MISQSIEDTFEQRKGAIRTVVTKQLTNKLETLDSIISEVRVYIERHDVLILSIIARLSSTHLQNRNLSTSINNFSAVYLALNKLLNVSAKSSISSHVNKNFFSSNLLLNELKPSEISEQNNTN